MTIDEIRVKKEELEQEISKMVVEFQEDSGVKIKNVECHIYNTELLGCKIPIQNIILKIEVII